MKCPHCGSENLKFVNYVGDVEVEDCQEQYWCPSCGTLSTFDDENCVELHVPEMIAEPKGADNG
ncbi:MAG: hypothetical protein GTN82_15610 [Candidatus Aminicenantes bacterium]|nr:hypothetical protein [Candidatus Aminicenantes bacterium]